MELFIKNYIEAIWVILGSLISIVVTINYKSLYVLLKRKFQKEIILNKRKNKDFLSKNSENKTELDSFDEKINIELDTNYDLKKVNILDEFAKLAFRPLLVISLVNLFTKPKNDFSNICLIILILWSPFHEMYLSEKYYKSKLYRFMLILAWLIFYVLQTQLIVAK